MTDLGPVSLIPRNSKSAKKKRPGFRPGAAAKKSNQNKSKSKTTTETNNSINDTASQSLIEEYKGGKKSEEVIATVSSIANNIKDKSEESASSISEETHPSALESFNDQFGGSYTTATADTATAADTTTDSTNTTSTRLSTITATTKKINNRKRKIITRNSKRIRAGTSIKRKTAISAPILSSISLAVKDRIEDENNQESTAICVAASDQKQNKDENSLTIIKKKTSIATIMSTSSAIIPAFSSQDQDILDQLGEENPKEIRLSLFCSRFKRPKRKIKDAKKSSQNSKKKINKVTDLLTDAASISDLITSNDLKINSNTTASNGAPVVQIINGEIVLQESSVQLPGRRSVQEVEAEFQDNVVEEDVQNAIVQASYASFRTKGDHGKKRKKGTWSLKETKTFYIALQQLGPDFGSMEVLFFENQRTRRQLKSKYQKELNRNPDFVQELALNPEYQIELDMTSFNLEVDPKQIEAHENEEAPPFEPTDENNSAAMTSSAKTGAGNNGNNDISNKEYDCEVVEEDAEEERRADLAISEANIWSTTGEDQNIGEEEIAEEEEIAGPSMEDFFHDTSFDNDFMDKSVEEETTSREEGQSSEKPQAITPAKEKVQVEELVSLVPKKTNAKPRRPKIRPTSRKKK
mmetsp:Transcript_45356/g.51377  ORF Transcript_45356/g.51377 Transcript_45356/m.51377 type:complete len:638 (+) Transcript_45356:77-1990(+)